MVVSGTGSTWGSGRVLLHSLRIFSSANLHVILHNPYWAASTPVVLFLKLIMSLPVHSCLCFRYVLDILGWVHNRAFSAFEVGCTL